MQKKHGFLALLFFCGLALAEWFGGWMIWMQTQGWHVIENTTFQYALLLVVCVTAVVFSLIIYLVDRRGAKEEVEAEDETELSDEEKIAVMASKSKDKNDPVSIENQRLQKIRAKNGKEEKPETETVSPKISKVDCEEELEQAKRKLKIARYKKIEEKITRGEIEVVPTIKELEDFGLLPSEKKRAVNPMKKTSKTEECVETEVSDEELKKLKPPKEEY
jgi:hypothetical protein